MAKNVLWGICHFNLFLFSFWPPIRTIAARMKRVILAIIFASILPARASEIIPGIRLETVAEGFEQPVYLATSHDGSGRLFVVEQAGVIRIVSPPGKPHVEFLDIRDRVDSGGEKGLLSVAFHPQFKVNRKLFVNYTTSSKGQLWTHISEFKASPDGSSADPSSERVILKFRQPYANHNGGHVLFGPDGYLYIGNGDGGSANDPSNNGQRLDTLLGKVLRIDVDRREDDLLYAIPGDNPFVARTGARPEIYCYGMRNPWRMCFDRANGNLYAADVGQWKWEEVDVIEKGKNYGWRVMEGNHCNHVFDEHCDSAGLEKPVAEYGHDAGVSITGGYVYRGKKFPALDGIYFYADYGSGRVWGLRYDGGKIVAQRELLKGNLPCSSFGEDDDGEVYLVSHAGKIYRIQTEGP